jgi:hypothetical protein
VVSRPSSNGTQTLSWDAGLHPVRPLREALRVEHSRPDRERLRRGGSPSYGTPLDMLQWLSRWRTSPTRGCRRPGDRGDSCSRPRTVHATSPGVVFDMVACNRRRQFSAALTGATGVDGDPYFIGDLPIDRGHPPPALWAFRTVRPVQTDAAVRARRRCRATLGALVSAVDGAR